MTRTWMIATLATTLLLGCATDDDDPAEAAAEVAAPQASCVMSGAASCRVSSFRDTGRTSVAKIAATGIQRGSGPWTTTVVPPTGGAWTILVPSPKPNKCGAGLECPGGGTCDCSVPQPAGGSTSCGTSGGVSWCFGFKADGTLDDSSSSCRCNGA
jgi:hypothetical protein